MRRHELLERKCPGKKREDFLTRGVEVEDPDKLLEEPEEIPRIKQPQGRRAITVGVCSSFGGLNS